MKDYYELLGISKNSTDQEIKSAYRKLALKFHPDRNKSKEAEDKFKEITKVYEVLSDPQKKATYDQYGASAFEGNGTGNNGGGNPFNGGSNGGQYGPFSYTYSSAGGDQGDFGNFNDPFEIFEQFFGGSTFRQGRKRRESYLLNLDFDEAVHGVLKNVKIKEKMQKINIPAGVDNGSKIRFDDFDVVIKVSPSLKFQRENYDLISEEKISFIQAILGDEIEIDTINGKLKLKIPSGTQPETIIRLRGKGVPHLQGSSRGDQYIKIKIIIPKAINQKQKDLLKEFREKDNASWFKF